MAQVLKDNVREDILASAKEEFLEYGYEDSSMRRIASRSKMTVGNLYRYFTNKEELNRFIVSKTYDEINGMLSKLTGNEIDMTKGVDSLSFTFDQLKVMLNKLVDGLVDVYQNHRIELNILMMGSKLNEEITKWFTDLLSKLIGDNYHVDPHLESVRILSRTYAIAIFHGLRDMLKNNESDIATLRRMVRIYLNSFINILRQDITELAGESL
jgi:AcrR family transcriptional regulator